MAGEKHKKNAFLIELNDKTYADLMRYCRNNGTNPHKFIRGIISDKLEQETTPVTHVNKTVHQSNFEESKNEHNQSRYFR
ncbi:hypothetical protein [Serratia quinivorans]|uniref:hypothetical protein n=1 Tax=Serratia quinivorans TaxID=137545 RepID=UPI002177D238|nr:hypothetical protein [Serratia quinivorans]CAI0895527.1 Uncharacterised protein [Serratia quinivorans]